MTLVNIFLTGQQNAGRRRQETSISYVTYVVLGLLFVSPTSKLESLMDRTCKTMKRAWAGDDHLHCTVLLSYHAARHKIKLSILGILDELTV